MDTKMHVAKHNKLKSIKELCTMFRNLGLVDKNGVIETDHCTVHNLVLAKMIVDRLFQPTATSMAQVRREEQQIESHIQAGVQRSTGEAE